MKQRSVLFIVFVFVFALGTAVVAAQGNGAGGKGRGGSNGQTGTQVQDQSQDCTLSEPQLNAWNTGGIGFVNPQTGANWNNQGRGAMGRGSGQAGTGFYASLPPATADTLPDEIVSLMVDGWVDEQHAYAVYEDVLAQFGAVAPFTSIQNAEAQHAAAWEMLFDRYGIAVPAIPEFEAVSFASIADACSAAAAAEIANFGLYDDMLAAFEPYPDLYQVALSLRNASEFNHLPAFESCAQ